ncbi:MAG: hypothetical protein WCI05_18135, partial [Myxococcales bacterium]
PHQAHQGMPPAQTPDRGPPPPQNPQQGFGWGPPQPAAQPLPQDFGGPAQGFGSFGAGQNYGQNASQPYGGIAPYGAQPQAMQQPAYDGYGATAPTGTRPNARNAVMTLALPLVIIFGGQILGAILGAVIPPALALVGSLIGSLIAFAGSVLALVSLIKMANELKAVTQNPAFAWWPILVPVYGLYWLAIVVPQEMARAKQALGVAQPARGLVVYLFLSLYAFASDLNDIARQQ